MQEYWEAYMKPLEGYPAMISFNAGIADEVPNLDTPYMGIVKVKINNPTEDGLVTAYESDDIGFIEDRLEMESLRWRSGKYIGRIISKSEVNFIYALKMDLDWKDTVKAAMQHFPEYKYEASSRLDSEWEIYQKLLFPNVKEWQLIANHHACDSLKEQGDNLRLERAIEHKAYFTNNADCNNFRALIEEKGFKFQKDLEVPFNGKTMYGIQFYRTDTPYYYDIDELTMNIIELSESFNGMYDGWECSLVKI